MKILLLANQPERTTRLKLFKKTLDALGHEVVVPVFGTRNWIEIARKARDAIRKEKPDAVHIFNVPDIIYHGLPKLKGTSFRHLIYDYRSPWGIEMRSSFGPLAETVCEHFEKEMARGADVLTSPNRPLGQKALSYVRASSKPLFIVPNYPPRDFSKIACNSTTKEEDEDAIVFVGRVSRQEGIGNLLNLARNMPEERFWLVGDGPFSRWHLRNMPDNIKFFGWQTQEMVACLVSQAKICLILLDETKITPFATEKSIWKLNEYLFLGKRVIATGISVEEKRKNLVLVKAGDLKGAIMQYQDVEPESMVEDDFRYWELNKNAIREVYEGLRG